jgi:hypothetical protein
MSLPPFADGMTDGLPWPLLVAGFAATRTGSHPAGLDQPSIIGRSQSGDSGEPLTDPKYRKLCATAKERRTLHWLSEGTDA